MRVRPKKSVDVPAPVSSVTEEIVQAAPEALPSVLSSFKWNFDKGDFYHWVPLINHFDQWLEDRLKGRKDLDLTDAENGKETAPIPHETLLGILRVTATILENCSNKHLYHSYEHMSALLASDNHEVVSGTLSLLAVFVRKTSGSGVRWHGEAALNQRLVAMAAGWGGREEGLELLACASVDDDLSPQALEQATALHFEFYLSPKDGQKAEPGHRVIHIPNLAERGDSEQKVLSSLVERYSVPEELRFALLSKVRLALAFGTLEGRRHIIAMRLLAFYVLFHSNPLPEEASQMISADPEFVGELVAMLQPASPITEELRTLSVRALAVQLLDRSRHSPVISAITSGGQGGLLYLLMQNTVAGLTSSATSSSCSVAFAEALLSLVSLLVASTTGCSALSQAGMLPALLPLVRDTHPAHVLLVSTTVRIMEAFMDYSASASSLFRELNGLADLVQRLKDETSVDYSNAPKIPGKDSPIPHARRVLIKALLRAVALASYAPSSGTAARPEDEDSQQLFASLKTMMERADEFGGSLFALAASVMTDLIHHDPLCYNTLDAAGLPEAFLSAVEKGVLPSSEAVCNVPNTLVALCLTAPGLERVRKSNALKCIVPIMTTRKYQKPMQGDNATVLGGGWDELLRHVPTLRTEGIEVVLIILRRLITLGGAIVPAPPSPPTPAPVPVPASGAQAADAPTGAADQGFVAAVAADLPAVATAEPMETEAADVPAMAGVTDSATAMEVEAPAAGSTEPEANLPVEEEEDDAPETYLAECVNNAVRMIESILSNSETAQIFLDKGGVQLLLHLYGLPSLPPSTSNALSHSLLPIFRLFAPNHGASLSVSVRRVLETQLSTALAALEPLQAAGGSVMDLPQGERDPVLRALSAAEGLAAVAGGVIRAANITSLQHVASETVPVLARLCSLEQLVFSQLALLEPVREEVARKEKEEKEAKSNLPAEAAATATAAAAAGPQEQPATGEDINMDLGEAVAPPAGTVDAKEDRPGEKTKRKKGPEDIAYEILLHAAAQIRGLYSAVAKTVHTPMRRRGEGFLGALGGGGAGIKPSAPMIGAAAALAVVLKANIDALPEPPTSTSGTAESQGPGHAQALRCWMRQVARVVEETAAVLFDSRRHTCHCLVLNFFVKFQGSQALVKQFGKAVQVLWHAQKLEEASLTSQASDGAEGSVVPYASASTGAAADAEPPAKEKSDSPKTPKILAEATVQSFLGLLDQLTNASLILGSPQAVALLTIPFPPPATSDSAAIQPCTVEEAGKVVKTLHKAALDGILPIWEHHALSNCPPRMLSSVVTILGRVSDGPAAALTRAARSGGPSSRAQAQAPVDPDLIQQIVDMGFTAERAEAAFRQVGSNSIELVMEWLIMHPEEPPPSAAAAAAGGADATPTTAAASGAEPAAQPENLAQILSTAFESVLPAQLPEAVAGASASESGQDETEGEPASILPASADLVSNAVRLLLFNQAAAFPLGDLLLGLCAKDDGKERQSVMSQLVKHLQEATKSAASSPDSYSAASTPRSILAPAHLLALLVADQEKNRAAAAEAGLVLSAIDAVRLWANHAGTSPGSPPPNWVDALLLVLDSMALSCSKPKDPDVPVSDAPGANQTAQATASDPVADKPDEAPPTAEVTPSKPNPKEILQKSLDELMKVWRPWGHFTPEEQDKALSLCLHLLRYLNSNIPPDWKREANSNLDPAATAQATLQLMSRLTKSHKAALRVLSEGGPQLMLSLPPPCFAPQLEPYISGVLRHILEDPITLQAAMEAEIRAELTNRSLQRHSLASSAGGSGRSMPVRTLITNLGHVVFRNPAVFMEAAGNLCTLEAPESMSISGRHHITLKKPQDDQVQTPAAPVKPVAPKTPGSGLSAGEKTPASEKAKGSAVKEKGKEKGKEKTKEKAEEKAEEKTLSRSSKKVVPASFVDVLDSLVDILLRYGGFVPEPMSGGGDAQKEQSSVMDTTSAEGDQSTVTPGMSSSLPDLADVQTPATSGKSLANHDATKQCMVLKMLTDFTLMYGSCVGVLLKRDADVGGWSSQCHPGSGGRGAAHTPGSSVKAAAKHHVALEMAQSGCSGLFQHVMRSHLAHSSAPGWATKGLTEQSSYFLLAVCVRSMEGRKRIVHELSTTLLQGHSAPLVGGKAAPADPMACDSPSPCLVNNPILSRPPCAPGHLLKAYVELAGSLLSASATSAQSPAQGSSAGLSSEIVRVMKEASTVRGLTSTITLVDVDHPQAPKLISAILKPLEVLTRQPYQQQQRQLPTPGAHRLYEPRTAGGATPPATFEVQDVDMAPAPAPAPELATAPASASASASANAPATTAAEAAPPAASHNSGSAAQAAPDRSAAGSGPLAMHLTSEAGPEAREVAASFHEAAEENEHQVEFEEMYGGRRLEDVVGHMINGMESEGDEDVDDDMEDVDDDEDLDDEEDEEDEDSEGNSEDMNGSSEEGVDGIPPLLAADSSDSEEDEPADEHDEDEDDDDEDDEEEDDDDGDVGADLIVDGEEEEEMNAVQEDGIIPDEEEQDDEDDEEDSGDDDHYMTDMVDEDAAFLGRPPQLIRDDEDGWATPDGDDMAPAVMGAWAGGVPREFMAEFMNQSMPGGVDEFMDELFEIHARTGDAGRALGGRRGRRFQVASGDQAAESVPLSASMAAQQHQLLQRPSGASQAGNASASASRHRIPELLGMPPMPASDEMALQNLFRDAMGMRGRAGGTGGDYFVAEMPNLVDLQALMTRAGGVQRARAVPFPFSGMGGRANVRNGRTADRATIWTGGESYSSGGADQLSGLQTSLEAAMTNVLRANTPSLRQPQAPTTAATAAPAPEPEAGADDRDAPVPTPDGPREALDQEIMAAQRQLSTQLLSDGSAASQPPEAGMEAGATSDSTPMAITEADISASLTAAAEPGSTSSPAAPAALVTAPPAPAAPAAPEPLAETPAQAPVVQPDDVAEALRLAMAALGPQDPGTDPATAPPPPAVAASPADVDMEDATDTYAPAEETSNASAQEAPAAPEEEALGSSLDTATRQAAEAAGVDLAFLEALPEELRAEVLSQHGVTIPPPAIAAAPAAAPQEGGAEQDASTAPAENTVAGQPAAPTVPADGAAAATTATTTATASAADAAGGSQPAEEEDDMVVDPDFLAALPPEIQAEVLAEQQAERRRRQRQREAARQREAEAAAGPAAAADGAAAAPPAGDGGQADMDMASILASFPPDLREEVLLTGDQALLASLPPALMAEAQSLRDRAIRMHPGLGSRLGDPSGIPMDAHFLQSAGRGLRAGGHGARMVTTSSLFNVGGPSRGHGAGERTSAPLPPPPEGPPQVDDDGIATLVQLLRLSQPLAKTQMQKLFMNVCLHSKSRPVLLRMLVSLLRQDGVNTNAKVPALPESSEKVVEGSLARMTPQMSRRILDLVTWLARCQPNKVARQLISLGVPVPAATPLARSTMLTVPAIGGGLPSAPDRKGKRKIEETDAVMTSSGSGGTSGGEADPTALEVVMALLAQPLCQRSNSHLEQVLHLLEVVMNAGKTLLHEAARRALQEKEKAEAEKEKAKDSTQSEVDATSTPDLAAPGGGKQSAEAAGGSSSSAPDCEPSADDVASSEEKAVSSSLEALPAALISQLPRLLGRRDLSSAAYARLSSTVSILAQTVPTHQALILGELSSQMEALIPGTSTELLALENHISRLADASSSSAPDEDPGGQEVMVQVASAQIVLRLLQAVRVLSRTAAKKVEQKSGHARRLPGVNAHTELEALPGPLDPAVLQSTNKVLNGLADRLDPLWDSLGQTISLIEGRLPDFHNRRKGAPVPHHGHAMAVLPPGASQVLPLIEAFFVLSEARSGLQIAISDTGKDKDASAQAAAPEPMAVESGPQAGGQPAPFGKGLRAQGSGVTAEEANLPFLSFAEQHRRLLNTLLHQNPGLLEGSLAPLVRAPRLIEFENKRSYFQSRMKSSREDRNFGGTLRICVRRDHVFEDSFHQLRMRSADEMRCKLSVQFQGEEGIDAGGVSREWYQVMAREIFNPGFSLFVNVPEGGTTFQPNPNSMVQNDEARGTNHLDFFKFVGRIIGKALHDGQLIDAYFTRSFYKHMLGLGITYDDIEAVDPDYYRTLKWMLDNDITDVLDMNFTAELDYFGKKQVAELRPGGADQKVTQENKHEYVNLVARHVMTNAIRTQIDSFLEGFWDLAPKKLVQIFNDHELELLISGLPEIDVDDLRDNTEYSGYTAASQTIQWFWEVVREMDKQSLALLLQFVTGTSKVPLEGFKALQGISGPQRFQIHKAYGPNSRLPSAHTCFNQLDMIEYDSKEQLLDRLMVAVHEGSEGFGFG